MMFAFVLKLVMWVTCCSLSKVSAAVYSEVLSIVICCFCVVVVEFVVAILGVAAVLDLILEVVMVSCGFFEAALKDVVVVAGGDVVVADGVVRVVVVRDACALPRWRPPLCPPCCADDLPVWSTLLWVETVTRWSVLPLLPW